jgi:transcriptional regulator GlxA family with amidase domain
MAMVTVEVLLLDGAMASSSAITLDVLTVANNGARVEGRGPVFQTRLWGAGACQFAPFVTTPASAEAAADVIIIPGQGFTKVDDIPARLEEEDVAAAADHLRQANAKGSRIASSCTGTLLLAKSGLLDGRQATTSWWLAPMFAHLFPHVDLDTRAIVRTDGPFTTAGAAMAQMDLMVGLVARDAGARIANWCIRTMLLDERRSQTPYMGVTILSARDDRISEVAAWARDHLEDGLGVGDLAARASMSARTFSRHVQRATGLSPIAFLQRIRLERAVDLLETTRLPFEEIAAMVGYADPSTLRSVIRREFGIRPSEVRARAARLAA